MADEMSSLAHQLGDVGSVTQEVFTIRRRTASIPAAVHREQSESLFREWPLLLPLLGTCRERPVDEHDIRAGSPGFKEDVCRLRHNGIRPFTRERSWSVKPLTATRDARSQRATESFRQRPPHWSERLGDCSTDAATLSPTIPNRVREVDAGVEARLAVLLGRC